MVDCCRHVISLSVCVCVCVCACVSHCVSTLSPAGTAADDMQPAHVAGVVGSSYLPPGEGCFQCGDDDQLKGFDQVSAGVPLVRRAQRRRRDTRRLYNNRTRPIVRPTLCLPVCLSVCVCVCVCVWQNHEPVQTNIGRDEFSFVSRRPASTDRTARRQFQATGQPVCRTQASGAMTSRQPRYEAKCVQRRCFQCGSVPLRSDIKGMELPPANILIPLER